MRIVAKRLLQAMDAQNAHRCSRARAQVPLLSLSLALLLLLLLHACRLRTGPACSPFSPPSVGH